MIHANIEMIGITAIIIVEVSAIIARRADQITITLALTIVRIDRPTFVRQTTAEVRN